MLYRQACQNKLSFLNYQNQRQTISVHCKKLLRRINKCHSGNVPNMYTPIPQPNSGHKLLIRGSQQLLPTTLFLSAFPIRFLSLLCDLNTVCGISCYHIQMHLSTFTHGKVPEKNTAQHNRNRTLATTANGRKDAC